MNPDSANEYCPLCQWAVTLTLWACGNFREWDLCNVAAKVRLKALDFIDWPSDCCLSKLRECQETSDLCTLSEILRNHIASFLSFEKVCQKLELLSLGRTYVLVSHVASICWISEAKLCKFANSVCVHLFSPLARQSSARTQRKSWDTAIVKPC